MPGKSDTVQPPTKALSGYIFFSKANQNDVKKDLMKKNPETKQSDVMRECGNQWKNMTDAQKKPFEDQADKDKARYSKEVKEFEKQVGCTLKEWKAEQDGKAKKPQKKSKSKSSKKTPSKKSGKSKAAAAGGNDAQSKSKSKGKSKSKSKAKNQKKDKVKKMSSSMSKSKNKSRC